MHATLIALRLVHILSAIFWAGTLLFTTFYLFPATAKAGPAAGPVMANLRERGFLMVMPVSALLTILSGLWLLSIDAAGDMGAYMRTPTGRIFSMSGGLAILAFVLGMILTRPAGAKLMRLVPDANTISDGPARAQIQEQIKQLQKRVAMTSLMIAIMVILAAAGMAIARYAG